MSGAGWHCKFVSQISLAAHIHGVPQLLSPQLPTTHSGMQRDMSLDDKSPGGSVKSSGAAMSAGAARSAGVNVRSGDVDRSVAVPARSSPPTAPRSGSPEMG